MSDEASTSGDSLRMREPGEWAGHWTVDVGKTPCTIVLDTARLDAANGWRLVDATGCLADALPGAVAWRPSPEGIEIAGADRLTLLALAGRGAGAAEGTLRDGRSVTLRRVAAAR